MELAKFSGILPALMTAFAENGIDCQKIAAHVERLKAAGVHGLYVGGSSGEMVLCSNEERRRLLECVMENAGELTVIAHIGTLSTKDSEALGRHARACGADAVSSVTPLYYKYTFEQIKTYYRRLCEASELPLIIYNIPAISGTTLNFDQLCELLELPGVGGMKFTCSDFFQLNRLVTRYPDKIFYNGSDEMLLSGLAAGAHGGIGTTYNFMPDRILAIYDRFRAGDLAGAQAAQTLVNRVIAEVLRYGAVPGSKAMIAITGFDYGICREPFLPLTEEEMQDLRHTAGRILAEE